MLIISVDDDDNNDDDGYHDVDDYHDVGDMDATMTMIVQSNLLICINMKLDGDGDDMIWWNRRW